MRCPRKPGKLRIIAPLLGCTILAMAPSKGWMDAVLRGRRIKDVATEELATLVERIERTPATSRDATAFAGDRYAAILEVLCLADHFARSGETVDLFDLRSSWLAGLQGDRAPQDIPTEEFAAWIADGHRRLAERKASVAEWHRRWRHEVLYPGGAGANPLEHILGDIEKALAAEFHYLAIVVSLTVPDICAALERDPAQRRKIGETYVAWCKTNLEPHYTHFTAEDCYRLRCGVIHEGKFGHP